MLLKILAGTILLSSTILLHPPQAADPGFRGPGTLCGVQEGGASALLAQQGSTGSAGTAKPAGAPAPTMAPAAVSPSTGASGVKPAQLERRTLRLEPAELTWNTPPGWVTFAPGRQVMSAAYDTYLLDGKSLEAVVGRGLKDPVSVLVEITATEARQHTPSDPLLPSPQGGFVYTTYRARVLSKAP